MLEDFINALKSFKLNKTRTILSLLGVIIGVSSVIVITSIGNCSTKQIENSFGNAGLDVVAIRKGFTRKKRDSASVVLNETFRQELFNNIKNIKKIWYKNNLSASLTYKDVTISTDCSAIEVDYLKIYNAKLIKGSFFTVTDDVEGLQKVIINEETAKTLFEKEDPLNKNILLTSNNVSFNFKVIGVIKDNTSAIETSSIFVPRGFYDKKIKPSPEAGTIMVQLTTPTVATQFCQDVEQYAKDLTGNEYALYTMSMQSMIDQMNKISSTMNLLLSSIAAISLLVGGIGIMNIMIVTVTERKQEIGIRKALGATPLDIKRQFLVESASISLLGGIIGIFIGIIISLITEAIIYKIFLININACFVSFIFSVCIGIIFGLSPAAKAAKLNPVTALAGV